MIEYLESVRQACKKSVLLAHAAREKRQKENKKTGKEDNNPDVGVIILDESGNELSCAFRHEVRDFHAEVSAIVKLYGKRKIKKLEKIHTVVTTLEPCSVRTKNDMFPCVKLLIHYGVKRVYIGQFDSDITVRGRGANILDYYGVEVSTFIDRDSKEEVRKLVNESYNLYNEKAMEMLRSQIDSTSKDGFDAFFNLFENAERDITPFKIENSPRNLIYQLLRNKRFIEIANESLKKFGSNKVLESFQSAFYLVYGKEMEVILSEPAEFVKPLEMTLEEAFITHLILDPKNEDSRRKLYGEIAEYIKSKNKWKRVPTKREKITISNR